MRDRRHAVFKHLDMLEWKTCRRCTRLGSYRPILWLLKKASWLGDYPAWIAVCLMLPLFHGKLGWIMAVSWGVSAAIGGLLYRLIKNRLCRERPYISFDLIPCTMPPLDRYSFPSGHTLHAVMFTALAWQYEPRLLIGVIPFAIVVMLSRVILGLHYISDVIAGALVGYGVAQLSIWAIDSAFPNLLG